MKDYTRVGLVLKRFRTNIAGKTQDEISDEYKMHPQFWSNAERGICLLPIHIMKRILRRKDFLKEDFESALKQDLIESQMQKYK